MVLRRWQIVKRSKRTGRRIEIQKPEARRYFWTAGGAEWEAARLEHIASTHRLPYTYRVERR